MVAATKIEEKPETALVKVTTGEARMAKPELMRPIARPADVVEAIKETQALLRETLVEGIDYGVIPGTGDKGKARKVLMKPGAEKISIGFGCHPEYELLEREVDHERVMRFKSAFVEAPKRKSRDEEERMKAAGTGRFRKVDDAWQWQEKGDGFEETVGLYRFRYKCKMVRFDGVIVGEGEGVCSSLESKYRSRPHDVENTILKMAQKRARIAATLDAFGLSDAFTQDIEDQVVDGAIVEERSPAKQAAEAIREAIGEAGVSGRGFPERSEREIAERKQRAQAWVVAYLDKLDKAGDVPAGGDDDAKKGALEAVDVLKAEAERAVQALAAVDVDLHDTVAVYTTMLEAHLHGLTYEPNDRERQLLAALSKLRGPKDAPPATT